LVVGAEASQSATNAEREVALDLLDQVLVPAQQRNPEQQVTLGADTQYQDEKFIEALRQRAIAPHVSEYVKGNLGKNSLDEAERSDPRHSISQQKRKLIERVFGWGKLDRPLRQVKLRGLKRVDWFFRLAITAYDLVRMRRLIPFFSVGPPWPTWSLQGGKTAPAEGKNITQGANTIETIKKTSPQRFDSETNGVFPQPV